MSLSVNLRTRVREWLLADAATTLASKPTPAPISMTLTRAYKLFHTDRIAQGRGARTIADYERCLLPFVEWCEDQGLALHNLTREHIREYIAGLRLTNRTQQGAPWQAGTVAIYIRNLRTFLNWLKAEEYLQHDLGNAIKQPQTSVRKDEVLNDAEFAQLLAACVDDAWALRDQALLLTLLDTGLRAGEVLILQRQQLHFEDNGIIWFHIEMPKTGHHRFGFLGEHASTILKAYLGSRQDQDPTLWLGKRGPLSYQGLQAMLERRAALAGFDKYRVHAHVIRKMFATRWIANGGDERSLQELIGWMSPKMLEIYVKISRRELLARLHRDLSPVDHWYAARSAPDSTTD